MLHSAKNVRSKVEFTRYTTTTNHICCERHILVRIYRNSPGFFLFWVEYLSGTDFDKISCSRSGMNILVKLVAALPLCVSLVRAIRLASQHVFEWESDIISHLRASNGASNSVSCILSRVTRRCYRPYLHMRNAEHPNFGKREVCMWYFILPTKPWLCRGSCPPVAWSFGWWVGARTRRGVVHNPSLSTVDRVLLMGNNQSRRGSTHQGDAPVFVGSSKGRNPLSGSQPVGAPTGAHSLEDWPISFTPVVSSGMFLLQIK